MNRIKGKNGSGIPGELFAWIVNNIKHGSTILELGAGNTSTRYLSEYFTLYSVEDNPEYCNLWNSTYIYAPLKDGWYDVDVLKDNLPKEYDALLIDGPVGAGNRTGILNNLDLFNLDAVFIFDDTSRETERDLLNKVHKLTGKNKLEFELFGVLL